MPADLWSEVTRLATSGLLVAAVAVPVGLVALALRPRGEPLLPRWTPVRAPWTGFEVAVTFLLSLAAPMLVLQVLEDGGFYQLVYGDEFPRAKAEGLDPGQKAELSVVRGLWAQLLALPLLLGALALARYALYPRWHLPATGSLAGKVALAVVAWCLLTPAVLGLNAAVNAVSLWLDVPPETHALTKLGGRPVLDQVLLALEACVGAPLREEIVIRGLMLWWCVGRIRLPGVGVGAPTAARPWFVLAGAILAMPVLGSLRWQSAAFAAALVVGLAVLWRVKRTGARRARAVYATAAFFALLHSTWPNPIPLFALGLGLGYLSLRTGGLLVPVLVHALFNAVSAAFVLRGGA